MITRLRQRLPLLDHVVRTYTRYQADTGDRLAAAVAYYWFLSLFPILLLAIYVFRQVNGDSAAADVQSGLSSYLPKELVTTISTTIGRNAGTAGLLGVAGLLLAGLGWIDALRSAIRAIWHRPTTSRNLVLRKLVDIAALLGLIATISASVFVTGLAGSGPALVLSQTGVDKTSAAVAFTKVLGIALAALADVALFLFLFLRLARVQAPFRQVLEGAMFGAVGFGLLKLVGAFYVQHTTRKGEATYGIFAVVIGLLLFLNLISRLVLYAAAFAVTASPQPAAEEDPMERSWQKLQEAAPAELTQLPGSRETPILPRTRTQELVVPAGAQQVQRAARVIAATGFAVVVAVAVYGLRTVQGLLRR